MITLWDDLCNFIYLPKCQGWIGKYPVTNLQYQRFLEAEDFANQHFWVDFPKYGPPPDYQLQGNWGEEGWQWLQDALNDIRRSPSGKRVAPRYWQSTDFGIPRPLVPVVGVTWYEANAYAKWLQAHWRDCEESGQNPKLQIGQLRLPRENEWEEAAGGVLSPERYAWDPPGQATRDINEIIRRANVYESKTLRTTPVNQYPLGISPLGVWDLSGNVWEWQANSFDDKQDFLALRGGSWGSASDHVSGGARLSARDHMRPHDYRRYSGFRMFFAPS